MSKDHREDELDCPNGEGLQGLEEVDAAPSRRQKGSLKAGWETEGVTSSSSDEDLCPTPAGDQVVGIGKGHDLET